MTKKWLIDTFERTLATAIEAGAAYLATRLTSIEPVWTVPIASGLAYVKSWVAKFVGNKGSASLTTTV